MKTWALPGLLVLALVGCERPRGPVSFGPGEAGLVLGYENPSLPEAQRLNGRIQFRVDATSRVNGGLEVQATITSLQGQMPQRLFLRKGGLAVWEDKATLRTVLPEGFPQVQRWESEKTFSQVMGRATVGPEVPLPPGSDRIGYWVETRGKSQAGTPVRSFFVPEVGVVETRIWQDGRWVTVQRLSSRMFADAPRKE